MKKMMKKIDKDDMKQLISTIKQFTKETKDEEIAISSSKISNKDILFYFIAQHAELESRVTKTETTLNLLMWFTGISLAVVGVGIGYFKL